MKVEFENSSSNSPNVSIILSDWQCRESFHILDYLNDQTVPRESYQVIWVEYYNRRVSDIEDKLKKAKQAGMPPVVDLWLIMGVGEDVYYHKHLMYNIGIIAASGRIVVICDSDAVVKPTFVESIINTFENKSDIVLHLDEVRNVDKKFYPFNYPSVDDIIMGSCINIKDGKTTGLLDNNDILHTRNYGACMCALRQDLIDIGGADEHIDYLGHICGPYEMTFRLRNVGKREIWHQSEFLYHTWHPGSDGKNNYLGPHDGYNMSTTAMQAVKTLRVLPLVENTAVKMLRTDPEQPLYESLLSQAIPVMDFRRWKAKSVRRTLKQKLILCKDVCRNLKHNAEYFNRFGRFVLLNIAIVSLILKQIRSKLAGRKSGGVLKKSVPFKLMVFYRFFVTMFKNNIYTVQLCSCVIQKMCSKKTKEFAVYGTGFIAKLLHILIKGRPIKIANIYDKCGLGRKCLGFEVLPVQELKGFEGDVVIASLSGVIEKRACLQQMGIKDENIIKL
ncbi:MAG: hypothetical protein K8R02_01640 [Anaerohalosphaeraceae bacterium]|nr:hypothetical protein [Anaerohalosphaeraceae bacterium]